MPVMQTTTQSAGPQATNDARQSRPPVWLSAWERERFTQKSGVNHTPLKATRPRRKAFTAVSFVSDVEDQPRLATRSVITSRCLRSTASIVKYWSTSATPASEMCFDSSGSLIASTSRAAN